MLTLATFNLCNLGANVPPGRLAQLAVIISRDLRGPDILAVQEIQAATLVDQAIVPADAAYQTLRDAVAQAGGPVYDWREVAPLAHQEGGHPGFTIRNGLLFNPQRVSFVDRGVSGPGDATGIRRIDSRPALTLSPGRIEPAHPAFAGDPQRHWVVSRKTLAGEFHYQDEPLFVIVCHLKSQRAATRRAEDYAKKQRQAQAEVIHHFVAGLLACDPTARLVVLGDMNDVRGSRTIKLLKGGLLSNLLETLPKSTCYTRRHGGSPQALDHVLVSPALQRGVTVHIPHVNSDGSELDQGSDHDPVLVMVPL